MQCFAGFIWLAAADSVGTDSIRSTVSKSSPIPQAFFSLFTVSLALWKILTLIEFCLFLLLMLYWVVLCVSTSHRLELSQRKQSPVLTLAKDAVSQPRARGWGWEWGWGAPLGTSASPCLLVLVSIPRSLLLASVLFKHSSRDSWVDLI